MSFWTAMVVIVAITTFAGVLIERYRALGRSDQAKARQSHLSDEGDAQRQAEARELAELRERIKVLERIATDANTTTALETRRVADEIEALRDR